jgi:hypothetical protein
MNEHRLMAKIIKLQGIAEELGRLAIEERRAGREERADRLAKLSEQVTKIYNGLEVKPMYEAIEVTVSWERCKELGITDALESGLRLGVRARLEKLLDVEEVSVGFSGWGGVDVWDPEGDKIEPPEELVKTVQAVIADEARKLTA